MGKEKLVGTFGFKSLFLYFDKEMKELGFFRINPLSIFSNVLAEYLNPASLGWAVAHCITPFVVRVRASVPMSQGLDFPAAGGGAGDLT